MPALRKEIGAANREMARVEYDGNAMIAAYRAVYSGAMRRTNAKVNRSSPLQRCGRSDHCH